MCGTALHAHKRRRWFKTRTILRSDPPEEVRGSVEKVVRRRWRQQWSRGGGWCTRERWWWARCPCWHGAGFGSWTDACTRSTRRSAPSSRSSSASSSPSPATSFSSSSSRSSPYFPRSSPLSLRLSLLFDLLSRLRVSRVPDSTAHFLILGIVFSNTISPLISISWSVLWILRLISWFQGLPFRIRLALWFQFLEVFLGDLWSSFSYIVIFFFSLSFA